MRTRFLPRIFLVVAGMLLLPESAAADSVPFAIHVVDQDTGRGVPLIELRTTNNLRFYTDSNGIVAFSEPGLMGETVYFHVQGHGYEHKKDGFGFIGARLDVVAGGRATIKVKRINIAERLYRITGAGIYSDSILVGEPIPIKKPVLNAHVMGSDSVLTAVFQGKVHWIWGDTNRTRYPLGTFHAPGATSLLPESGGLDPDVGVDLEYFESDNGFVEATAKIQGKGATWMSGLIVLRDKSGKERMFAHYVKVKKEGDDPASYPERGLAEFNSKTHKFEHRATYPAREPFPHGGHPILHTIDGVQYVVYCAPYPTMRVPANPESLADQKTYEAFTPLVAGSQDETAAIDQSENGKARFTWKKRTSALRAVKQQQRIKAGDFERRDTPFALRNTDTDKDILAHRGSIYWNVYRKRWVLITGEVFGSSVLGETWYAESDALMGPWTHARKIVTHDKYSFYNPKQHPFFDKKGGRWIYFEGTYTTTFSGTSVKTPRYDYNQIMYRLDLANPRLNLPVMVYEDTTASLPTRYVTGSEHAGQLRPVFRALERPDDKTVGVYETKTPGGEWTLTTTRSAAMQSGVSSLFHALPADTEKPPATTVPLYVFTHTDGKRRIYATDERGGKLEGYRRSEKPFVRVWRARPVEK
jgi:hypothetical protein